MRNSFSSNLWYFLDIFGLHCKNASSLIIFILYMALAPCHKISLKKDRSYSPAFYSYTSYYFAKLRSNFSLYPFNSFCFSYKLLRSLHNFFIRSNFSLMPSRHSGSIRLYSPVRLWILLLFSFICSETHIQSTKFRPLPY